MKKGNDNYNWQWGLGIGFIGFFLLLLFEPPPDYVTFQCDRANGLCTIERSVFFQSTTQQIKIYDIRYAHFEKLGLFIMGYHGPEIKLKDGNDVSIGAGAKIPSKEKVTVGEINSFLSNADVKQLSIVQKGFPTVIIDCIFLFCGIFFIYKALKPYVIQGLRNNRLEK